MTRLARLALVASAALLVAGCKSVYFATVNAGPSHAETVIYDTEHRLALDVYRPPATSTAAGTKYN
jgi:hypothetical protein